MVFLCDFFATQLVQLLLSFGSVEPGTDLLGVFSVVVVGIPGNECQKGVSFEPGKSVWIVQVFFRQSLEEHSNLSQKVLIGITEVPLHLMQRTVPVLQENLLVSGVIILFW